jgi:hypothetical protein
LRASLNNFRSLKNVQLELRVEGLKRPVEGLSPSWPPPGYATTTSDLRLFHLTETFNFVPGDNSLLGFWNTMIPSEPADLHETESENQQPQLREATVTKLQSEVIRLNYTDVNIDKLVSRSYLHPTQAIVFHVGESPELPIYAHHFKAIESKLTCGGLMADVALEGVDKLLKQFFPGHTRYWSEFEEQKGFPDQDRTSSESQDETDQFYRKLIESVNKDDEIIAQAMKN